MRTVGLQFQNQPAQLTVAEEHAVLVLLSACPMSKSDGRLAYILRVMEQLGLVEATTTALNGYSSAGLTTYAITNAGRQRLHALEQAAQKNAKAEARKQPQDCTQTAQRKVQDRENGKHDYAVAAFSAVLGSLCTLLMEHANGLINAVHDVVRALFH